MSISNNTPDVLRGKPIHSGDAVSLFAGCGGFCEGIELAGFNVRAAVEMDRFAAETYRHNFSNTPLFEGDIRGFLGPNFKAHQRQFGLRQIELVFGGPPCQGYSQIGPRDIGDERNGLYREFARVVGELRPRVFLMENVPNLLLLNKGHFRDLILRKFRSIGYSNATFVKVTAADFGVPQIRQRVFFFGTADEHAFPHDLNQFSEQVLAGMARERPFTVWDAVGDLPAEVVPSGQTMPYPKAGPYTTFQRMMRLDFDYQPHTRAIKRRRGIGNSRTLLHNHHTKEIQDRRRHLISFLKPGEKADSLPKEIWNGRRPEKWRRLHPDLPSYTILAQMHRDLSEWVHPKLERWITVREAARLQSFHDGFVFVGSEWQQLKQIGNAVPPLLAFAAGKLARQILIELDDSTKVISARTPVQTVFPVLEPRLSE